MTLTTHAITGAALATLIPNYPILGFVVGFGSHFILDAIPHWDYYHPVSKKEDEIDLNNGLALGKGFLKIGIKDLLKIGIDGLLGLLLSFVLLGTLHQHSLWAIFMGAIGGMTPDALQFFYFRWKHEPLKSLQRFHVWFHSKTNLDDKPIIGILSQVAIICFIVLIF
jgi:hypothetical protein